MGSGSRKPWAWAWKKWQYLGPLGARTGFPTLEYWYRRKLSRGHSAYFKDRSHNAINIHKRHSCPSMDPGFLTRKGQAKQILWAITTLLHSPYNSQQRGSLGGYLEWTGAVSTAQRYTVWSTVGCMLEGRHCDSLSLWTPKSESEVLSHVRFSATPWAVAYQPPPSMGFSRQESWSGCHSLLQNFHDWSLFLAVFHPVVQVVPPFIFLSILLPTQEKRSDGLRTIQSEIQGILTPSLSFNPPRDWGAQAPESTRTRWQAAFCAQGHTHRPGSQCGVAFPWAQVKSIPWVARTGTGLWVPALLAEMQIFCWHEQVLVMLQDLQSQAALGTEIQKEALGYTVNSKHRDVPSTDPPN